MQMNNTHNTTSYWIRARQKAADAILFGAPQNLSRGLSAARSNASGSGRRYFLSLAICALLLGTSALGRLPSTSGESPEAPQTRRRGLTGSPDVNGAKHWVG